jgi:hypothetical protein
MLDSIVLSAWRWMQIVKNRESGSDPSHSARSLEIETDSGISVADNVVSSSGVR